MGSRGKWNKPGENYENKTDLGRNLEGRILDRVREQSYKELGLEKKLC